MKINDDHLYHGAALIQIAEHDQFTAINAFTYRGGKSRSAFRINDEIGVYLKYSSKPTPRFKEYPFAFRSENLEELKALRKKTSSVFIALVCVKDRHICCLPYNDLLELIARRQRGKGSPEDQYTILATLPARKEFRVYVNAPGVKKTMLGKVIMIARKNFPDKLFE